MPLETIIVVIPAASKVPAMGVAGLKQPLAAQIGRAIHAAWYTKYVGAVPTASFKSWLMSHKLLPYLHGKSGAGLMGKTLAAAAPKTAATTSTTTAAPASQNFLFDSFNNANNLITQAKSLFDSISSNIIPLVTGVVGGAAGGGALHLRQSKKQQRENEGRFAAILSETRSQKQAVDSLQEEMAATKSQVTQLAQDVAQVTTATPTPAPPAPTAADTPPAPKEGESDDLELIKGIGPVFAQRLNEAGITTFAALAALPPDQISAIISAEDRTFSIDFEEWIRQARHYALN